MYKTATATRANTADLGVLVAEPGFEVFGRPHAVTRGKVFER